MILNRAFLAESLLLTAASALLLAQIPIARNQRGIVTKEEASVEILALGAIGGAGACIASAYAAVFPERWRWLPKAIWLTGVWAFPLISQIKPIKVTAIRHFNL